jgi:hypothetical protein
MARSTGSRNSTGPIRSAARSTQSRARSSTRRSCRSGRGWAEAAPAPPRSPVRLPERRPRPRPSPRPGPGRSGRPPPLPGPVAEEPAVLPEAGGCGSPLPGSRGEPRSSRPPSPRRCPGGWRRRWREASGSACPPPSASDRCSSKNPRSARSCSFRSTTSSAPSRWRRSPRPLRAAPACPGPRRREASRRGAAPRPPAARRPPEGGPEPGLVGIEEEKAWSCSAAGGGPAPRSAPCPAWPRRAPPGGPSATTSMYPSVTRAAPSFRIAFRFHPRA